MLIRTSKARTLSMALANMFALQRGQPLSSILLVIWSLLTLGWFVNSSTDSVAWLGEFLIGGARDFSEFGKHFSQALIPSILLFATIGLLYLNYWWNRRHGDVVGIAAEPHRGLIVQLSDYQPRISKYKDADQVSAALANNNLDLGELLKSNFGSFTLAARYHSSVLEHCWILTTELSGGRYPLAENLIKSVTNHNVKCYQVPVSDPNDIGNTASVIRGIYLQNKLPSKDIIADFTGGTAAMSGGMILATLDEEQDLEYLRQDLGYFNASGVPKDNATIRKESILVSPRTSREMVY